MGLREDSKQKVCEANREMIKRSYLVRCSLENGETEEQSIEAVKKEFTEMALCPAGGIYTYTVSALGEDLTIRCKKHPSSLLGHNVKESVESILTSLIEKGTANGGLSGTVTRYDSGSIGLTYKSGQGTGKSNTTKIETALNAQGLKTEGTTWSVEMDLSDKKKLQTVCWMEDTLNEKSVAGGKALVICYDADDKTYTVGRVKVKTQSTVFTEKYQYFDNTSFKAEKGSAATSDFNEAYAFYLKAQG